jgi:hypothetical protein
MTEIKQAIKIEQLKQERDNSISKKRLELININSQIKNIDSQISDLTKQRHNLNATRYELWLSIERDTKHFDLLIKAYQSLGGK